MNIGERISQSLKLCSSIFIASCIHFNLIAQEIKEASSPSSIDEDLQFFNKEDEEISDWEARLELARALSHLKRYEESIQEYQKLIALNPHSSIARIEMATIFFYLGKTEESLREFSQISPKDMDDKTWIVIAELYRNKKDYQKAEEIYFQYLKKLPQDDKVRLKLAELLSWQKRYNESIQQYQIILSHRPSDIQVRRRYAQVLTWMGQDEEAIKEWKRTLQ